MTTPQPSFEHDVFISYDEQNATDSAWVREVLIPRLVARGVKIVPPILIGESTIRYTTHAIDTSRYTLMILTPSYVSRAWNQAEQAMLQTRDPINVHRRFLPLILTPCDIPANMRIFAAADFTTPHIDDEAWERLFVALETAPPLIPDPHTIPPITALPAGSRMPYTPNPLFVGREEELRELARLLTPGTTAAVGQIAAASGLGGIGKTQLAVEFVHRYGARFRGGVFWLSMAEAESVAAEVAVCAEEMGLNVADRPLDEQVKLVQRLWKEPTPRLLVFDNCEEEALLQQWRPKTGGCSVLVTTRQAIWDRSFGVQLVALGVLPRTESVALLRQHRPDLRADDPMLDGIAEAVGDLPLALHLAGSYLDTYQRSVSPSKYLAELHHLNLLKHPCFQSTKTVPTGHEAHVARTFALSYERLNPTDPTDALALALLARAVYLAPGEPIPLTLLATTVAEDGTENVTPPVESALRRLATVGLIDLAAESVQLHRLVWQFVRAIAEDNMAQAVAERALIAITYRLNMAGYPATLLPIQGHLRYVLAQIGERTNESVATLITSLGYHLKALGDYGAARPLYERALRIREQALGPDHPLTASSLNNLATLLRVTGDYGAARSLFERALRIREQALGPDHPDTAQSLNNLAMLLRATGDYGAARPLYERALRIREQALGLHRPEPQQPRCAAPCHGRLRRSALAV